MRVLITGAGGFVGRHAMRAFAERLGDGDRLVGIGRDVAADAVPERDLREIDLLDRERVASLIRQVRPTHVLHLAALASVHQSSGSPAETWRTNVLGLLNLAEAIAAEAPGSTFLFVSSGEVYGRAFLCGHPVDETVLPRPANAYARSKLAGEQMLADILPSGRIKLVVLRPFNHVGRGQDERFVAPSFAKQVARIEAGEQPPVVEVGDLSAKRDILDVADVVAAYVGLVAKADSIPDGSIFNVASGAARPISDILDLLRAKARVPFEVRVAPERLRPSEIPMAAGDSTALRRAIGWRPRVALSDSIDAILEEARTRLSGR